MGDIQLAGGGLSAKETLSMSLENVAPLINPKTDFANIKGKIEPTRDLILKLIDPFNLSFDTDLVKEEKSEGITYYTFKAKVTGQDGRTVTGWGKCGTDEVNGERAEHDALTKAETRALKRAIEAKAGYGMVNQLILKFFGGYSEPQQERNVTPEPDPVRKALVDRLVKLGDAISPADKESIRKTLKTLSTAELAPYVKRWEDKVAAVPAGAGVPDEQVPY